MNISKPEKLPFYFREKPQSSVQWLITEFEQRKKRNPRYSLRAYAHLLGLSPGRLSEIFSYKRRITAKMALRLAEALAFSPENQADFLRVVQAERDLGAVEKATDWSSPGYHQLSEDAFRAISEWYHYGILSLVETDDFKSDPRWIASRLGLSTVEVSSALERLIRLELLEWRGPRLARTVTHLKTSENIVNAAVRRSLLQSLERSIQQVDEVPITLRDVSSMTMAIDPKRIDEAKDMIRKFRRRLCKFLESDKKVEVYELNVQLMPLTKTRPS